MEHNYWGPKQVSSDNGPQFKSEKFKEYCKSWGIEHDPSSPYQHEAYGYAEAAVKSMKNLVKKICPSKTVIEVKSRGRSYLVRSEMGILYWRNSKFIRPYFLNEEDKDDNPKQAGSDADNRSAGHRLRRSKRDCHKLD